jgi:hypothetical protein
LVFHLFNNPIMTWHCSAWENTQEKVWHLKNSLHWNVPNWNYRQMICMDDLCMWYLVTLVAVVITHVGYNNNNNNATCWPWNYRWSH